MQGCQVSVSLMFLPNFKVFCDLLPSRHWATWNLFVLYNKEVQKLTVTPFFYASVLRQIIDGKQSKCAQNLAYFIIRNNSKCRNLSINALLLNSLEVLVFDYAMLTCHCLHFLTLFCCQSAKSKGCAKVSELLSLTILGNTKIPFLNWP